MFEILNGRGAFWQWDINQKLVVQDLPNCAEVHFSNENSDYALVTLVKTVDGRKVCDVPNVVLQKSGYVKVFAYVIDGEEKYTEYKSSILILARSKPEDYIYTETETLCYKNLSEKIGDVSLLETDAKENLVDAVNEIAKKAESGADLSLGITGAEAGQIATVEAVDDQGKPTKWKHENIAGAVGFPAPTVSDNGKYLGCENGAATWKPVEASGGGDISLGLTAASVGQTIKVKAVDENGKPTEWEAVDMLSGGGHWETVLDTVWEQDVINPAAFDSETGIFTCASGELDNLALDTEYVFFQQCVAENVAYNTILGNEILKVTKLSDTTFSIDVTPPTTFVPTNVKFSRGACLTITDIDAKKIRLTLDGQFKPTATLYDRPFYASSVPYFGRNTGYVQIRSAYHAYQQVTAEVESPYRIVGKILCGFNAPSQNASFHFKNNSFCCPLVPSKFPEGDSNFSSDGTKIAKLYSTGSPWLLGGVNENTAIGTDYLRIISGTKVKLERWVE